ncbi:MAG: arylesterase [Rhodospirillaceae bacterium]
MCGCSEGSYAENEQTDQSQSQDTDAEVSSSIRILALGDSLTAGYGLDDLSLAFPARLEEELRASGHDVKVLDAGISGDTTAGGRSRLDWSLADSPDAVIVGLGGNDGLRAVDPDVTYDNLNAIVGRLTSEGLPVLLAGMQAPPNLGREYGDRFFGAYLRLAEEYDIVFYPFLLDGVAGEPSLNQADRIHPNPDGVNVMVEKLLPYAEQLVKRVTDTRSRETAS